MQPSTERRTGIVPRLVAVAEKLTWAAATVLLSLAFGGFVRSVATPLHQPGNQTVAAADINPALLPVQGTMPAMDTWSEARRQRYIDAAPAVGVLAELMIPRLQLRVPVFPNDNDEHLDVGAGVVEGMAYPDELGHIGIAAHRDGYFRPLKDIAPGDYILLQTRRGPRHFVVQETRVVEPEELHWLQDTPDTRLTLVTCYPFYFVGSAPQRFLVRAVERPDPISVAHTPPPAASRDAVQ